jgi:hypothetical protein
MITKMVHDQLISVEKIGNDLLTMHTYLLYLLYSLTHTLTRSLTHSLTPKSRVLLEKLTCLQIVKKFPACYGTQR